MAEMDAVEVIELNPNLFNYHLHLTNSYKDVADPFQREVHQLMFS